MGTNDDFEGKTSHFITSVQFPDKNFKKTGHYNKVTYTVWSKARNGGVNKILPLHEANKPPPVATWDLSPL